MSHKLLAIGAACALSLAASGANAGSTYDFGTVAGQSTGGSVPLTVGDATFSSPSDVANGGEYTAGPNAGLYSTLGSAVLSSAGNAAFGNSTELDIAFSTAQTNLNFNYAIGDLLQLNGGDSLTVTTNGGYSQTFTNASIPAGDSYPQGLFSLLNTASFTSVTITATENTGAATPGGAGAAPLVPADLAISNLSTVPLPPSLVLFVGGLAGLGFAARRKAA